MKALIGSFIGGLDIMYDTLTDTSLQTLHKLRKQFVDEITPTYVKAAGMTAEPPTSTTPAVAFADPIRRRFPCHNKVATWLSGLYYWGQKANGDKWDGSMPEHKVEDRIEKAAKYWGVYSDLIYLQKQISTKSASACRQLSDSDYALAVNYGSERILRFPVVNAATVKKAADNFYKLRSKYPYGWRKTAAQNILKKAMEFDVNDIEPESFDYLFKAAGAYPQDNSAVSLQLKIRTALYPSEVKPAMNKAAARLDGGGNANMEKLCRIIDTLDRRYKKHPLYNSGMPMPEEVCFSGPSVKYASAEPVVSLITGTTYTLSELKSAGLEPYAVLDDAYISAIVANDKGDLDETKIASVLPTIPRDDARALEAGLAAVGVKPMAKEARKNLDSELSMNGIMEYFGKPSRDFGGLFRLQHGQATHDKLDEKQNRK